MKNNTGTSRITAAAGTSIGRSYISWNIIINSKIWFYNNNVFITKTIWLGQALAHCPRFLTAASTPESGPCLSPNVAVQPLSPAKHDWLGVLLITPTT